jgi:hypothetical protein
MDEAEAGDTLGEGGEDLRVELRSQAIASLDYDRGERNDRGFALNHQITPIMKQTASPPPEIIIRSMSPRNLSSQSPQWTSVLFNQKFMRMLLKAGPGAIPNVLSPVQVVS